MTTTPDLPGGWTVQRRTFQAAQHPKASQARRALNVHPATSEYMPGKRYHVTGPVTRPSPLGGDRPDVTYTASDTFSTKQAAIAYAQQQAGHRPSPSAADDSDRLHCNDTVGPCATCPAAANHTVDAGTPAERRAP